MISKTGIHAIKAMVTLAELPEGAYAGAGAIADSIGAPRNYLGKLLQMFSHEGYVTSQKGMGGGFRLAKDPKKISLMDIINPIDHIDRWNGCFLGRHQCSGKNPCAVHAKWDKVRTQYIKFVTKTSIADLTQDHNMINTL